MPSDKAVEFAKACYLRAVSYEGVKDRRSAEGIAVRELANMYDTHTAEALADTMRVVEGLPDLIMESIIWCDDEISPTMIKSNVKNVIDTAIAKLKEGI